MKEEIKLELKSITKYYGKNKALSDFSAELTPGIYALLGPNGSGKSTLMNIITDNLKSTGGEIFRCGENVRSMGVRFREKIGFMPQYPGIYPSFTVGEFMYYMAALKGMPKNEAEAQVTEALSAVELSDSINSKVRSLSGGMKQRLALAQATIGNPEILILDEPTAGLDPKQRIAVRNYISKIALQKIVIIATHVVSDIEYIAKEAIILKKGVIIASAPPAELAASVDGKVWLANVPEAQVEQLRRTENVTAIHKDGDAVTLRIISDEDLSDKYEKAQPTLEDYYLYVFGNA